MRGSRTAGFLVCLSALCANARADEFELRGNEVLRGELLAAGPTRILVELPAGSRFLDRSQVLSYRDRSGGGVTLPEGPSDPSGLVTVVQGPVRVRRGSGELEVSVQGRAAILYEGDQLRTGPYGKLAFRLPTGGVVRAWGDAVLQLRDATPTLSSGTLRLRHAEGKIDARIASGRIEAIKGTVEAVHLRGRTRIRCLAGRARVFGNVGYRLDLPRNHVVDVSQETPESPATLSARATNAFALQLEVGRRRIHIQRGERVLLLGAPKSTSPPPAEPEAAPRQPLPPILDITGRVISAESSFALQRANAPLRRVEPSEAQGFVLEELDRLVSDAGAIDMECGAARYRLAKKSEAQVQRGRGVPLRLLRGQLQIDTARRASVALPGAELGIVKGSAAIDARPGSLRLSVAGGTAGARVGDLVRAELLGPAELLVEEREGDTILTVPKGRQPVPVVLGGLDLRLRSGRVLRFRGTRQMEVTRFEKTRLELIGGVRARIVAVPGAGEDIQLLGDGRSFRLGPGTYRFYRQGNRIVAEVPQVAPPPPGLAPTPAGPRVVARAKPVPAHRKRVVGKRHTLQNGAIVITRSWGPLVIRPPVRRADGKVTVAVAGPQGDLVLEPKTQIILTRLPQVTRMDLPDGRYCLHETGAKVGFTAIVRANGILRVDVDTGERSVEVESGVQFDLSVRRDDYVLTYIFGQAVYLEARQHMAITQREGLRLRFARKKRGLTPKQPGAK
jgi:hypothetical protein